MVEKVCENDDQEMVILMTTVTAEISANERPLSMESF